MLRLFPTFDTPDFLRHVACNLAMLLWIFMTQDIYNTVFRLYGIFGTEWRGSRVAARPSVPKMPSIFHTWLPLAYSFVFIVNMCFCKKINLLASEMRSPPILLFLFPSLCFCALYFYTRNKKLFLNESDVISHRTRLLCWIMTGPATHATRARAVKETWAKHCQKHIFMSSEKGEQRI